MKKIKLQMVRYILFSLFVCLFVVLKAQDNQRLWTDGRLTWADFKGEKTGEAEKRVATIYHDISYLGVIISYKEVKIKHKDTTIRRFEALCTLDQKISWILPYYKTEQYLKYNQVIFDIAELYARKLQYVIDDLTSSYAAVYALQVIQVDCSKRIKEFREMTAAGQNSAMIDTWQEKITSELAMTENYKNIPTYEKRSFGYALHAGLGGGIFTGSLGEHFLPTFNILFGFDVAYKRSILFLNATLAFSGVKSDYQEWVKGKSAHFALLDLSYGYAVIDNAKWKLTPFAGLGISGLSKGSKKNEDLVSYTDYNFIFGLNADYKFKKTVSFIPDPFLGVKENVELSVRGRLYVARANYYTDLQGLSINLAVEFCGFGNFIKLKR